jgi:nicotinate-nucleotide--dimethylbenzimidazole phosphoribosyltransferase
MNDVLGHIIESISPASVAQATGAAQRLLRAEIGVEHGDMGEIATRLCAARHSPNPQLKNKQVVVVAADHGVASPGIELGPENPTAQGVQQMARGDAAINSAVRSADGLLVLVDAGIRGGDKLDLGPGVLSFRTGDATENFTQQSAMTLEDASAAVQTGIAIAFSLADAGMDLLALGQLSAGSQPASAAIVAALTGATPSELSPQDSDVVTKALRLHGLDKAEHGCGPLEILSLVGGFDIGVLTGLILASASIHVPIVLDGHGTSAAALLAVGLKHEVREYLFASHAGGIAAHKRALEELKLTPLFTVGLAQGEGTGAVLAIPMLEAAARVIDEAGR